jgi:orotate phosphoribosyltransferase-like protein
MQKARSEFYEAWQIHAFLLRCEGLTYMRIAERLGVSRCTAAYMVGKACRRLSRAWQKVLPF